MNLHEIINDFNNFNNTPIERQFLTTCLYCSKYNKVSMYMQYLNQVGDLVVELS